MAKKPNDAIEALEFIKDFILDLASSPYGFKYRPLFNMVKRRVKILEDYLNDKENG